MIGRFILFIFILHTERNSLWSGYIHQQISEYYWKLHCKFNWYKWGQCKRSSFCPYNYRQTDEVKNEDVWLALTLVIQPCASTKLVKRFFVKLTRWWNKGKDNFPEKGEEMHDVVRAARRWRLFALVIAIIVSWSSWTNSCWVYLVPSLPKKLHTGTDGERFYELLLPRRRTDQDGSVRSLD